MTLTTTRARAVSIGVVNVRPLMACKASRKPAGYKVVDLWQ